MKAGQKSKRGGVEDILFPMEVLNITQGDNVGTHAGTYATDTAGKDTGIDPVFAPFTMTLVTQDEAPGHGNAMWFTSDEKVRFADGTIDYCTIMTIHDDYIKDTIGVRHFAQGQEFSDEGTAGYATGNHLHIEFAKGKFAGMYAQNSQGTYHLPNNMPIEDACFMDGTEMKNGYADWKYTDDVPVKENGSQPSNEPDQILHVGEKCVFNGNFVVEALNIPNDWVLNNAVGGWFGSSICEKIGSNQILNVGDRFNIPGTYTVGDVNAPADLVYLNELGFWVKASAVTEV